MFKYFVIILIIIIVVAYPAIRMMAERLRPRIVVVVMPMDFNANFDPESETVHDSKVQDAVVEKYKKMELECLNPKLDTKSQFMELKKNAVNFMDYVGESSDFLLLRSLMLNEERVENLDRTELEIFSVVWHHVIKNKIDPETVKLQLKECVDVCLMGRVARYIGLFDGIVPGYLGETPVTETILFQEALRAVQVILNDNLRESGLMEAYTAGEDLSTYMEGLMPKIKAELDKHNISAARKQEILSALT